MSILYELNKSGEGGGTTEWGDIIGDIEDQSDLKAKLDGEIDLLKDTVGWTGKNLLPYPYYTSSGTLSRGVTFTWDSDGVVYLNGTPSTTQEPFCTLNLYSASNSIVLKKDVKYILSLNSDNNKTFVIAYFYDLNNSSTTAEITGKYPDGTVLNRTWGNVNTAYNGVNYDWVEFSLDKDCKVQLDVRVTKNTAQCNNNYIKPMLRLASINDATYEPYHSSVKQTLRDAEVIEGKNLIPYPYSQTTRTSNGVTYTDNGDGTITLSTNGGTSGPSTSFFYLKGDSANPSGFKLKGNYIATCENATDDYYLRIGKTSAAYTNITEETNISFDTETDVYICLRVASGVTISNVTLKPMLRYITEEDDTYEPYYIPLKDSKFDRVEQGILGAKNLIPYPYENISVTHRGITFTANNDGTIGYAGTASTASTAYAVFKSLVLLKAGSYKLTGGDSQTGGLVVNFFDDKNKTNYTGTYTGLGKTGAGAVYINTTQDGGEYKLNNVYGYEKPFTINSDAYVDIYARSVSNAYTSAVSGTIYPMLRLATDADNTYQPYAETNYQLTHNKVSYEDNGVLGAKNLLPYPYKDTTMVENYVTFTDNGDGTILVNGTASGNKADFEVCTVQPFKKGTYTLSGCPSGGSSSSYCIWIGYKNNISDSITSLGRDTGDGFVFDLSQDCYISSTITISVGTATSNLLFKPMIRLASDPDETWQPYAMTNQELTDANKELTDGKVSKTGDTITGTLILSRTTDASGTVNNKPALIVGGTDTQPHIEIDSNEIMAKADGTTTSELYLNSDGGLVRINGKIAGKFTSTPTDKYVLVADGTEGNIKSISTLPVAQGGTGHGSAGITANAVLLGNDTSAFKTIQTSSGAFYATASNGQPLFGVLPVSQGGTGHGSNGLTANAVLLGNGTSAFKTIATGSGAFYATATNGQPLFGILPVAQGGTGGSTAAAARSGLDVYSKGEVNTNINNLNTAINGKASLEGAKFTGNVDTNGYLYVSNGTTSVGFHSGTHNSTQCVNTTAPIQSNYGALVLASLGSTHVVSIRGKETHIRNNADSAYVKIYASAFDTSSSRRYKENIQNLSDEEAKKLLDVNVVTFDFKKDVGIAEDNDRLNKFGVIAEDVVEICPDVVSFREIDGEMLPDSVDYSKFVPRLIKMIQIQEERINELERRINNEL